MGKDDSTPLRDVFDEWQERREAGDHEGAERIAAEHPELADLVNAAAFLDRELGPDPAGEGASIDFHDFRIRRELGRGGMGVVYEADQISLRRTVALKVLAAGPATNPKAVQRFEREAHAAARLHHTNIVPIYAMGRHEGRWFYAMELVEGRSLGEVIDDLRAERDGDSTTGSSGTTSGGRNWYRRVAEMFAGVADALELAHRHHILHRDVKPSNLILDEDGALKLVDFGLALDTAEAGPSMTITGDLIGTPAYMSPEQATAKKIRVDHRTDVYSLGATLYELLSLEPPFRGDSIHELCSQILTKDPVPLRKRARAIPRDLETIVAKAMEKDRESRYKSAAALARDLRAFAVGGPIRARRISPVGRAWRKVKRNPVRSGLVAAVLLLATVGVFFYALSRSQAEDLRTAEYLELLAKGERQVGNAYGKILHEFDPASIAGLEGSPTEFFDRAIELDPDRPEAYWLRVFAPGRSMEEREADAEAAFVRGGLSRRSRHLYSAFLAGLRGHPEEATRQRKIADSLPSETPFDDYLEGRLLARAGRIDDATAALNRAIGSKESSRTLLYIAHRFRSLLRRQRGDAEGVVEDLLRMRDLGDDGPITRASLAVAWLRLDGEKAEAHFEGALEEVARREDPHLWGAFCNQLPTPGEVDWISGPQSGRWPDSRTTRPCTTCAAESWGGGRTRKELWRTPAPRFA